MKKVIVKVPATTANIGPGFDVLGMSLNLYNTLELELLTEKKIEITTIGEGKDEIKSDFNNLIWQSIKALLDIKKAPFKGAKIKMENNIPLSRGLGSSSAAIVAALFAANAFLDEPLSKEELFYLATKIEGHPDNVAPAIFGGLTISMMKNNEVKHTVLHTDLPLKMVVAIPDFHLSTQKARSVLKEEIPLDAAIKNIASSAMLITGFLQNDAELLQDTFEDYLAYPYRKSLIPGIDDVIENAKENGALGATISGAGPTIIAFTLENALKIGEAMCEGFKKANIEAKYLILDFNKRGVELL